MIITPKYDDSSVSFFPVVTGDEDFKGLVEIFDDKNNKIGEQVLIKDEQSLIKIENFKSWSPESPFLYQVKPY